MRSKILQTGGLMAILAVAAPAQVDSTRIELANLRQDVSQLTQRVGEEEVLLKQSFVESRLFKVKFAQEAETVVMEIQPGKLMSGVVEALSVVDWGALPIAQQALAAMVGVAGLADAADLELLEEREGAEPEARSRFPRLASSVMALRLTQAEEHPGDSSWNKPEPTRIPGRS